MKNYVMPLNLNKWIDEHRDLLKPPVCNKQVFEEGDFIVMVVGGPNNRSDYHYNETPELFYQIEGEMTLKVKDDDSFKDIPIKQGEMFLLPPKLLHSPQRMENSIGLVVEQKRAEDQKDELHWFCTQCNSPMYKEAFSLANIEKDLPVVFANFFDNETNCTCNQCGYKMTRGDHVKD